MYDELWGYFLASLISIVIIINPFSTVGVFLSLTKGERRQERHRIAFLSSLVAFCILFFFALTGFWIFQVYSITIDSFRIAGGIALLALGLNMLFPKDEEHPHAHHDQVYIVPLAIPMASGPGAITATIVLAGNAFDLWHQFMLWIALFLGCAFNYVVLRFSENIDRLLGKEGIGAMIRIMGLLIASLGVEFVITGLRAAFPILLGIN
ncbi:hypothetical protein COU37_02695 [Candidatus Micrarchaeota archaeon CG10_big_fil_rev_8_21_14_0_10_45_29]|nr:MAG: hypothetical protein COU37_02695 [Candidatus Micrarchaeota archaeon CG10_big_fil_rev_8_21_14_0_10_45_29]